MTAKDKTVGVHDLLARGYHPPRVRRLTPGSFRMILGMRKQTGRTYGPRPKALPPTHSYPMTAEARTAAYAKQGGPKLTPAQRKRQRQKNRSGVAQAQS